MFSKTAAIAIEKMHMTHYGLWTGGMPGIPGKTTFGHWQAPKYGNWGEYLWNTAFRAAQLAIAIAASVAQSEIADNQMELAESWYSHAEYKWNRFKDNYMPLEKQILAETGNKALPTLDCKTTEARTRNTVNIAYNTMNRWMHKKAKALCLCMDDSLIDDLHLQRQVIMADTHNYNYDDDRWWRDYQDDKRWNRRSAILNLGRNTSTLGLSYGRAASAIYGQLNGQIGQIGQTAMQGFGFFANRFQTYMPMSYLGTGGQGLATSPSSGTAQPRANIAATNLNPSQGG